MFFFQVLRVQRPNSQSTFRQFDQNYLWQTLNFEISSEFRQYFQKMEFRKNSDSLPKILIHKEVVIFVWNCAFSDKNDKFRQNGQGFLAEFSAIIMLLNSADILLVSNCLNSAKKSKAISDTLASSLWIRLQIPYLIIFQIWYWNYLCFKLLIKLVLIQEEKTNLWS